MNYFAVFVQPAGRAPLTWLYGEVKRDMRSVDLTLDALEQGGDAVSSLRGNTY